MFNLEKSLFFHTIDTDGENIIPMIFRVASTTGDLGKQFLQRLVLKLPTSICVRLCMCVCIYMYILYVLYVLYCM